MDAVIGDFDANTEAVLAAVTRAAAGPVRPDLVVFPELCLSGYPPLDLLEQLRFARLDEAALRRLQKALPRGIPVALGHLVRNTSGTGRPYASAVSVILDGAIVFTQAKTRLASAGLFAEERYFEPATDRGLWEHQGVRIGFLVGDDIGDDIDDDFRDPAAAPPGTERLVDPPRELLARGADLVIVVAASPYRLDRLDRCRERCSNLARRGKVPVAYCNMAGANDSVVFDGRSFLTDRDGRSFAPGNFGEGILLVDTDDRAPAEQPPAGQTFTGQTPNEQPPAGRTGFPDRLDELERALVEGIRGYIKKCGFKKAHLGLSGGIDSAIVALLAAKAIGAENLTCVAMPSRFSSAGSLDDSVELARNLACRLETLSIEGPFSSFLSTLEPHFRGLPFGLTEENLQARIRGDLMMAWSNKFDSILLTTGNKSELAVGYCTLYGDMCGALAPIGDLYKTEVFALCERIYAREGILPRSILDKPPSAELRPDQLDQDSLPPYETLDGILRALIEDNLSVSEVVARGYDEGLVRRVASMYARAEYKRRQAAPVLQVSRRAFGPGRLMPLARALYELRAD